MYIVVSGQVTLTSADGKVLSSLTEMQTFGEKQFQRKSDETARDHTARVMDANTVLLALDRSQYFDKTFCFSHK